MKITASEVNKLRQHTGAGMMDCKKALTEANGDFDAAVDILRKKGQKVAAKRSDRDAAEGLVIAKTNDTGDKGVIIVLNCETDFVAKNEDFGSFADTIATTALENGASNLDELKEMNFPGTDIKIADRITEEIGKIGEKIDLSAYSNIEAASVVAYNHPGNSIASLVGFNAETSSEKGRDVAMQIAAMAPVAVDKDSVPQDVIDKELEIGKELAIQEGKPAEMAEKISFGRLNKFFKENTLMNQAFIKDNKKSIKDYLQEDNKERSVTTVTRYALS